MKIRVGVCLCEDLLRKIDEKRGLAKRSSYIEYLIVQGFKTLEEEKN
jgi:metal-responsive CopG/Arc/MetJ family transcriptional regulator